jgi:4-amino-4-deoxy-L-arabinose transferase-like glycosyltransferase
MGRKTDIARQGRSAKAPTRAAPQPPAGPLPPGGPELAGSFWRRNRTTLLVLGGILVLAGGLRFVNLGQSPPGTVDDECVEIWNAYCIEQTGHDWHGESWPVLSTRALGYNLPTIFMYCLVPFQAAMGMSLTSARFATAVLGTLDVLLLFVVAWRMFGRSAGLLAAAMLALCPWHLRNSRYAFLANSIFIILPIALMMLANLPLQNAVPRRPRPLLALLAGAVMGMCCYGYPSIRLFLPLFLIGAVAVSWRSWWQLLRARRGALAVGTFVLGLAATLGPLVYAHLEHPERMAKRSNNIMIWAPTDSLSTKVEKAAARYLPHFGADFLFVHGDGEEGRSVVRRVPETGAFQWYLLPMMLAGLAAALWKVRTGHAARVLLAGVILYPAADLAFQAQGVHLYRSLPGLPMLILLSAFGAARLGAWLWARKGPLFWGAAGAMGLWVVIWSAPFFHRFYVDYNRLP